MANMQARTFTSTELRAQRNARIVYSIEDINAAISAAAVNDGVCNLSMGADIYLTQPIIIPDYLNFFRLSGQSSWRLYARGTMTKMIDIQTGATYIGSSNLQIKPVIFQDMEFQDIASCTYVFGTTSTADVYANIICTNINFAGFQYLTAQDTTHLIPFNGLFQNCLFDDAMEIAGATLFTKCRFEQCRGSAASLVPTHTEFSRNTFEDCSIGTIDTTVTRTVSHSNIFINVQGAAATPSLNTYDIAFDSNGVQSFSYRTAPVYQTLTADNQTVSVSRLGIVILSSDSAVAGSRTFTLTGTPLIGQQFQIIFSGANTADIVDGSGAGSNVVKLSANMTFTADDTLTLVHNGTAWCEVSRSVN